MDIPKLAIKQLPIEKVLPYPANAKTHPEHQVAKIAASISEFGFVTPIFIDEKNIIIAGHGRLLAAKRLEMDKVPTVKVTHLSDAQVKAYRIADNRISEDGDWDGELLTAELEGLVEFGLEDLVGFDAAELADLIGTAGEGDGTGGGEMGDDDAEKTHDRILELGAVTIAEPNHRPALGEVWRLGDQHFLVVGSPITDHELFTPLLTAESYLCPWAGPWIMFGKKANAQPLVLVQPDLYFAGHILDRWQEIRGQAPVRTEGLGGRVAAE